MEGKDSPSFNNALKRWSSDIKQINKKTVLIILLILYTLTYTIYSLSVIHHKNKFEESYNKEFYSSFLMNFLGEDPSIDRYANTLIKAADSRPVSINDIEPMMQLGNNIDYSQNNLCNFYAQHYKKDKRLSNLYFLHGFFANGWLYESSFEKKDNGEYVIKDERLKELNNYYMVQKAETVSKILSEFKSGHRDYLDELRSTWGKGFVKDGIWIELLCNMNEALKEIERDYDFGAHAPGIPEFRSFDSWSSPREVQYFSMNHHDALKLSRIYSVIDTESGVYFYYCVTGERKTFEVESFKVEDNLITVVIDEGEYTPYSGTDKSIYNTLLIRGIKPGESKNYSFRVLNNQGEEFKRIEN